MAVKFLEPGGDATFNVANKTSGGFWDANNGAPAVATDFVHGTHVKSIQYRTANTDDCRVYAVMSDAGSRISLYLYLVALPSALTTFLQVLTVAEAAVVRVRITTGGVLRLANGSNTQIGTDGATLSTGVWYRLCLAYTITDATTNQFRLYKDGVSTISVTNGTLTNTVSERVFFGNMVGDGSFDIRTSDHYIDDSNSLADTGDIWVTAKRPFSNGSANNFTTQIGSGGSSYGSGHAPQVNERALSITNGWSMIGAGAAVTEEYTIEGKDVGDMTIGGNTLVDYVGWIDQKALVSETATIVTGGANSTYATSNAELMITKAKGSAIYPAGGTDIGVITSTDLTTFSLYECGIIVAFIGPPVAAPSTATTTVPTLLMLGVG